MSGWAVRNDGLGYRAVDSKDDCGDEEVFRASPSLDESPTKTQVDLERDRRIDAGVDFQGRHYQTRPTDRENISGAAQLAFMAIVGGAEAGNLRWRKPDQDFTWIATDNSMVPMDAATVVAFGEAAAERKQQLIYAGRQLKDKEEVPMDYADDKWWP